MGLMDKVKKASEQALSKAQEGVKEGRAKLDEVQAKRQWDALLRDLGAAAYAERREGGPASAVDAALAALDDHARTHGAGETTATSAEGDGAPASTERAEAPASGERAEAPAGVDGTAGPEPPEAAATPVPGDPEEPRGT